MGITVQNTKYKKINAPFLKGVLNYKQDSRLKYFWTHFFCNFKHPFSHVRSHTKFGPDLVRRFDVYLLDTNSKTNKQTPRHQDKQT